MITLETYLFCSAFFDTFYDRFVIEVLFFFFRVSICFFGVGKIRPFCSVVFRIAPADDIYICYFYRVRFASF